MIASELILPFGLPPAELARDVLRQMKTPALATLLGQARTSLHSADPYARVLPHQAWLLGRMAGPPRIANVAKAAMAALGLPARSGHWLLLHPAHFHIARDHLVLTDLRQLPMDETHSRALFEAAAPLFGDAGMELVWGRASLWFLRADALQALDTASPDMAVGHNIDIWMPRGEGDRAWRRIHNEVQMCWHAHAVNEAREMAGLKPVNALWCWNAQASAASSDQSANALPAFFAGAPLPAQARQQDALPPLQVLDSLAPAALAGDWGRWLQTMEEAEQEWFAPALRALQSGRLSTLRLLLGDDRQLLQADCSRLGLKKFWRRPSLASMQMPVEAAA